MKERPILFKGEMVRAILDGRKTMTRRIVKGDKCPYGKPGDRLWVRETWSIELASSNMRNGILTAFYEVSYRAGGEEKEMLYCGTPKSDPYVKLFDSQRSEWKPSIFMPRSASRITLEITDIRVERLQDITEKDAEAEGVSSKGEFKLLWQSISGPESWTENPYVWVIEFKRV